MSYLFHNVNSWPRGPAYFLRPGMFCDAPSICHPLTNSRQAWTAHPMHLHTVSRCYDTQTEWKNLILTVSDWLIVLVKREWCPLKVQGVSLSAVSSETLTGATVDNAVAESPVCLKLKFRWLNKTANKALTGGNSDPYLELYRRLANTSWVLYPTYYQAYSREATVANKEEEKWHNFI